MGDYELVKDYSMKLVNKLSAFSPSTFSRVTILWEARNSLFDTMSRLILMHT